MNWTEDQIRKAVADCGLELRAIHADRIIERLKKSTKPPRGTMQGDAGPEYYKYQGVADYYARCCDKGCDCSCCYGYPDRDCHCYADPCNCGGTRKDHGQKPL